MRCSLAAAVIAVITLTAPATATASTVVDFEFGQSVDGPFDYRTAGRGWNTLAALNGGPSYRGLTWSSGWEVVTAGMIDDYYRSTPGAPMGGEAAYNGDGVRTVTVTADAAPRVRLVGADFRAWPWRDRAFNASARAVTIAGLLDGVEVASGHLDDLGAAAWSNVDFAGTVVDAFTVTADGAARYWLMDNLEVVSTPLPAAAWMMLAGLGGIAGVCRQHRRRSGAS